MKLTRDDMLALYRSAILQQQNPAILMTQGGAVDGWQALDSADRAALPRF